MRTNILFAGLTALTLAACGSGGEGGEGKKADEAKAPAAAGLPNGPTPGLWRITTQVPGMPAGMAMPAIETCVTRQDFSEMQRGPGQEEAPEGVECSEQTFRRDGDAMVGHSVCNMQNGVRAETDIRVTGDFSRRYSMEVRTRMTPAPAPSMADTTMTMTAERLGDCPAGSAAQ